MGLRPHRIKGLAQLRHLGAAELRFQFGATARERKVAHAAVMCGRLCTDQLHGQELSQGRVEGLFAYLQGA